MTGLNLDNNYCQTVSGVNVMSRAQTLMSGRVAVAEDTGLHVSGVKAAVAAEPRGANRDAPD